MKALYIYKGRKFYFVWWELETAHKNDIVIVSDPGTDQEKVHYIKCHDKAGTAIQINKKSLSATGGAYGVIKFIKRAIENDISTCYIDKIINQFGV